jgi:hypothetical protein
VADLHAEPVDIDRGSLGFRLAVAMRRTGEAIVAYRRACNFASDRWANERARQDAAFDAAVREEASRG